MALLFDHLINVGKAHFWLGRSELTWKSWAIKMAVQASSKCHGFPRKFFWLLLICS
jgi:hypothetical protein